MAIAITTATTLSATTTMETATPVRQVATNRILAMGTATQNATTKLATSIMEIAKPAQRAAMLAT
jgi:hypothetical protein